VPPVVVEEKGESKGENKAENKVEGKVEGKIENKVEEKVEKREAQPRLTLKHGRRKLDPALFSRARPAPRPVIKDSVTAKQ
jgi:hypothetical protein